MAWSFSELLRWSSGLWFAAPSEESPEEDAQQAGRADDEFPGDDVDVGGVDRSSGFFHDDAYAAACPREFHAFEVW